MLIVGIDIGSTTIKCSVVNEKLEILYSEYERHHTKIAQSTISLLERLEGKFEEFKNGNLKLFMTGSGAQKICKLVGAKFVQEVNAVALAVEKLHPKARSVIELGGQDAKVIIFKDKGNGEKTTLTYMNDKCASGTGATIDKCMLKVGMKESEISSIKFDPKSLHHVAAKCGVFAETDIVNLIKSSVPKEEILNSLADAIVNQNLSVLTRGNTLKDEIILLGGPNTYLPFLVESWKYRITEIWKERGFDSLLVGDIDKKVYVPNDSLLYAALGCCYYGVDSFSHEEYRGVKELKDYASHGRKKELEASAGKPLVSSESELNFFKEKYSIKNFISNLNKIEKVDAYLGIDGGSTSTKCALINPNGDLVLKKYTLSKGNPFEDYKSLISKINEYFIKENKVLNILGLGVTGYAANILEKVFKADVNVIETIAHMNSSKKYFGSIDVICDIGGQDIKVLFLKNDELVNFKLSNQCSAGNGMILQAMAEYFGHDVKEYADVAFQAEIAPVFSYGCGVFLDTDRVNFQKQGFTKEEIMAGLAQVLPKNIWQYVVQVPRLDIFGRKFVLQGGTQYNQAALKAQVDYIKARVKDAEVFVHPHPGEAGAIGAALEAKERVETRGFSSFIGVHDSSNITYTTTSDESTRCTFCPNNCARTFVDTEIPSGETVRYISGFSCDKGTVENKEALALLMKSKRENLSSNPNLVRVESKQLFKKDSDVEVINHFKNRLWKNRLEKRSQIKIGMPRVLNMWVMAPFFNYYFQTLGLKNSNIIWSSETNEKMSKEGMKYGSIDPCFPAKVVQAHIHELIFHKEMDYLFFPAVTNLPTYLEKIMGSTACPVVQGTPYVMKSSFTLEKNYFEEKNIDYIPTALNFEDIKYLKKQLFEIWKDRLDITRKESDEACELALERLNIFDIDMQEKGKAIIKDVTENNKIAILFIGRPYHLDHGMNHQILDEIQNLGFPVLTMRSIPKDQKWLEQFFEGNPYDINDVWPENFSTNSAQKVWAAKFAARNKNIAVIDISSFKCGHDAPTYGIIDRIMSSAKSAYLTLHDLDQTSPTESFKIRLKTFAYNLNKRIEKMKFKDEKCNQKQLNTGKMKTQDDSQKVISLV